MTKDEITICKMYLEDLDSTHTCNEYKLLMGLLEQPTSDDCVSRQAVLDKAWDVPYEGKYIQVVDVGDIQELPPVTPTRKVGKWINSVYSVGFTCTCCSLTQTSGFKYDYCPNCGAKMRGAENE